MEINNWYKLTFEIEANLEEIIIWKLNDLGIFSYAFEILLNILIPVTASSPKTSLTSEFQ